MRHSVPQWIGGRRIRVIRCWIAAACSALPAQAMIAQAAERRDTEAGRPQLVVLVAVDQMRSDYFDRFGGDFTGGLGRIRTQSAFFGHGLQDHANTETGPGHSTMLSGREPVHTGIVSNERGVPDPGAPLLGTDGEGASPRRFVGTTLYDWLRMADARSRVLSVSRKDRGAILPIGRARGDIYWWANGMFTTSRYYADSLPSWVRRFNDRHGIDSLAGTSWSLLLAPQAYPEADSMPYEHDGQDFTFPHALPHDRAAMRAQLANYPWMDSVTLAFALDGVRELELGRRGATDLVSISLSTTDAIGHAYGPDSREIHDHVVRLDRWLGAFLDSLGAMVSPSRTLLVLTSDHGVTPFPERIALLEHRPAGRLSLDDVARRLRRQLTPRYAVDFGVEFGNGLMLADTAALGVRGIRVDSLASALASEVRQRTGIAAVYTPRTLKTATGRMAARWRRAIPTDLGWLICVVPKPDFVWSDGKLKAEHGTVNDLDVAIPIAFMGGEIAAASRADTIRSVDIAPTIAALLHIRPAQRLDGRAVSLRLRAVASAPRPE